MIQISDLCTKTELHFVIYCVITQLIRKMHIRHTQPAHTPPSYLTPGLCGKVDLLGILFISLYIQLQSHTNYIKNTSQHEPPAASACEHTPPSPHAPISLSSLFLFSVLSLVFPQSNAGLLLVWEQLAFGFHADTSRSFQQSRRGKYISGENTANQAALCL